MMADINELADAMAEIAGVYIDSAEGMADAAKGCTFMAYDAGQVAGIIDIFFAAACTIMDEISEAGIRDDLIDGIQEKIDDADIELAYMATNDPAKADTMIIKDPDGGFRFQPYQHELD